MNDCIFNIDEEVEYCSLVDYNWKRGIITRFTQEGFMNVAIVWENGFANRIPLNSLYIRKIA